MAIDKRPNYIRLAREATPIVTTTDTPFEIGKAYVYRPGNDVSIITTGTMTYHALVAAAKLAENGISAEVVHVPTIKPLDTETILNSVDKTRCAVTAEEGQMAGGLGSVITELVCTELPVPVERIGMQDRFGESGNPDELLAYFGLDAEHIQQAAFAVLGKKP